MPSHYLYKCDRCDYEAIRYRNVTRCKCGGNLTRVEGQAQAGEHQELKIGIAYYLVGYFPAVPYETAGRIADDTVEKMLRAARRADVKERAKQSTMNLAGQRTFHNETPQGAPR